MGDAGYAGQSRQGLVMGDAAWEAPVAFQTAADKALCRIFKAITVKRIGVLITTAVTVTAAVLDFDRRVTPGSDTGRVSSGVGRITAPVTGSAIGQVVYKNVSVDLNPGDEVVFELVTASTAGGGIPIMEYIDRPEEPANFTEMVASA